MPREELVAGVRDLPQSGIEPHNPGREELAESIRQAAREIETAERRVSRPVQREWSEGQLPHGYNRTRVVLLVRDPYWLHCYWEVGAAEREHLRSWAGRELWELPNKLRVHDLTSRGQEAGTGDYYDVPITSEARNWYLETGRPGHTFLVELGVDVPGQGFYVLARSNSACTPTDRVSDILDEDWMIVEEDFRRLYQLAAGLGQGHSSVELMESLTRRLARRMGSGAVSSLGSGFRLPPRQRRYWLVVGTELIVHGATQPDATVTIDGLPVALRPDGTFSARFALPDGEYPLPVTGASADGQDRVTIVPVVTKRTN